MTLEEEFYHLEKELKKQADWQQLSSDPHVELVRIQYGRNKPRDSSAFRVLIVLKENMESTHEEILRLVPETITLPLINGQAIHLPVETMTKNEYTFRERILPGTLGARPIDESFGTDIIE